MKHPHINEFAEQWLRALKSGKYKKGAGYLCMSYRFSYMEVAEDLAGTPYKIIPMPLNDSTQEYHHGFICGLTPATCDKLNLRTPLGAAAESFKIDSRNYICLTQANDDGCSFKEIATAIRKNPELFFNEPEELNS